MNSYRLGRITLGIDGIGPVVDAIREEASALPVCANAPSLLFRLGETRLEIPRFEGCGEQPVCTALSGMTIRHGEEDGRAVVEVITRIPRSRFIPPLYEIKRIANWNYLYPHENTAKNFWYNVFDWATQIANLAVGQSWAHASAVSKGGRSFAFLAKGGVGKTTAMLKLCLEDDWSYLSDDLVIVDDGGNLHRSPKRLQVYAYNTEGQPAILAALMQGRSLADRMAWTWRQRRFGAKAVRRRVSAESLFGPDKVAETARASGFVFLDRVEGKGCRLSAATSSQLADRMAPIIMQEIEPYSKVAMASRGLLSLPCVVERSTREVLETAFSKADCMLLSIGSDVSPNDLLGFIRRNVI